ncbi:hypothetical protein D9M69_537590 [compost metagenome]
MHFQGHVLGALHQRQLGRRLALPALVDHGARIHQAQRTGGLAQALDHAERQARAQAEAGVGRHVQLRQHIRQQAIGALVLLPGADRPGQHLEIAHRALLEGRGEVQRLALGGDQQADQAFAGIPLHPAEVAQVAASIDERRRHALLAQARLQAGHAGTVFGQSDRLDAAAHVAQFRQRLLRGTPPNAQCHRPVPLVKSLRKFKHSFKNSPNRI